MRTPKTFQSVDYRAKKSKDALRAALLKLLKRKAFDEITIREIAATANVAYATFFRHHPNKENLLQDIAEDEIARLIGLTLPLLDAADRRAVCLTLCEYVHENRAVWSILLNGGAAGAMRAEFLRQGQRFAQTRTPSDTWLPAEIGSILTVSGMIELLAWWLRSPEPLPTARIAQILDRAILAHLPRKVRRRDTTKTSD